MAEMWVINKYGIDHICEAIPKNACTVLGELADALRKRAREVRDGTA